MKVITNSRENKVGLDNEIELDLMTIHSYSVLNFSSEVVDARDLHDFLETTEPFDSWILDCISDQHFVMGTDYFVTNVNMDGHIQSGSACFFLTLDMAIALSEYEHNEKGDQAQQYILACEHELSRQKACQTSF